MATGIAVVAALGQYAIPAMIPELQRVPGGLQGGQWWRLVTPLLVQTLGWYQVVANLVTLAVIGALAEWLLGRWRWLALSAGGTIGGQVAAYAWHDPGGGDSIAICGLAAGVAITLLAGREPPDRLAASAVVLYVAALAGWELAGPRMAVLAVVVTGAVLGGLRLARVRGAERAALAITVPCALVMTARHDLHGASLLAGMLLMSALLIGEHLRRRRSLMKYRDPAARAALPDR